MKREILSMLDTTKKKAGVALLCSVLVATLGAGTAYAANSNSPTSLLAKMKNGVATYSTDGGKTWSKNAPDGVMTEGKDGKVTISNGIPPKDGKMTSLAVKEENGVRSYSTDGGNTWSQNAPDGMTMTQDKDGKVTISNGTPPKDGEGKGVLSKEENGVRSYSTDGGKTWSKNSPDGAEESVTIGND